MTETITLPRVWTRAPDETREEALAPKPRALRRRLGNRWFHACVTLPTLLAGLYYGVLASDIYVSQSRFVIKSASQRAGSVSTLGNLIQTQGASANAEQADEVLDYVRSRGALAGLVTGADLRRRYGRPDVDWLSRYPQPFRADAFENFFRFYQGMVEARRDGDTGSAVLEVHAFTPDDARAINENLLAQSEALVNRLNMRAEGRAITEGQARVAAAEARLRVARGAMGAYRNSTALVDPARQTGAVIEVSAGLEAEHAALAAQLQQVEMAAPANPAIPALRARVAALAGQIGRQNGRMTGGSGAISSKMGGFEKLQLEQEFATQALAAANTALEQARTDAARQQFYLERVVEPTAPDLPELPHRLMRVLSVLAVSLCIYLIGWMLAVGIREHAPQED